MIVYSPITSEVLTDAIKLYPRSAFIMTQLGGTLPQELILIRKALKNNLHQNSFNDIDASSLMTGKDFLDKIWKIILGAPLGIAIITKDIQPKTLSNIYYELGIMDALGKETLIIKSKDYDIPSDFKRTEYLNFDKNFKNEFQKFIKNLAEREDNYWLMAELLEADPLLSIDYLRRAFLLSPLKKYQNEAKKIYQLNENRIDNISKIHIKNFIKARL